MNNYAASLALSWRLLRRDARAGELRLLFAALVLAVAALTSVGFFADRVRQSLEREAHQLLGADLLLTADHAWPVDVLAEARRLGLKTAETRLFPSMVTLAGHAQLAEIKAVSASYPLRGHLRWAPAVNSPDSAVENIPPPGSLWLDERLTAALEAHPGDAIAIGRTQLKMDAVLTLEPDRGVNFFSVAPRLLMNLADLDATGLIQVGSRVAYRLLVAGEEADVQAFRRWIEPRLGRGERVEDAQNARPEMRNVLERAQSFLGLSALLTVILAAVAVALAARRYMQRHLDACAVMRCLGASQGQLLQLHLLQFLVLGFAAALLGCAIGYGGHWLLHLWLAELLATPLPSPSFVPAGQGATVGLLLLFGFALPPLLQLKSVPTLRVLRRELDNAQSSLASGYALGLVGLMALMFWIAGDLRLGSYVVGGFTVALMLFAGIARGAVKLVRRLRKHGGFGWRYGVAGLERRPAASVVQIVALALGFLALMLLTVTRGDLLDAWRRAAPPDAPNRFVINIQPEQVEAVRRFFAGAELGNSGVAAVMPASPRQLSGEVSPELSPMIRGRLARINGRDIGPDSFEDERAKHLVDREFNLSWRADLPPGNLLPAGRWFVPSDQGQGVASVEDGLAKTLGLVVGDEIEFVIAGASVKMRIVGLRKLDWDSMRVNFFVLTPPGVLERFPASYITSFHLDAGREDVVNQLIRDYPNLTVVDVGAILRQLQAVLDQVAHAVQFVFLFTLAAGVVVLYAALLSAFDERRHELAVMRALGASRQQLRQSLLAEFAAVGAVAGLIAALGTLAISQVLARQVFHFNVALNAWLPPLAALAGAALVMAAGWLVARRLLDTPPLEALRSSS